MCGILASCLCRGGQNLDRNKEGTNGIVNDSSSQTARDTFAKELHAGADAIKHRGPDGNGVWVSQDGRVGLAHCRLSINDLSENGFQPLHSNDRTVHAVVNGEIYDHDRLRELCVTEHGYHFTSESDSELVIALYLIFGTPGLFKHLRGEFAFVLFDQRQSSRKVIAGRDRFGIKPLLWTVVGQRILFASEAKAFLPLGWTPEWDVRGITDCGWLLDDRTIFKGVKKLMPGHWIEITDKRGLEMHRYWDAEYPDKTKPEERTVDDMILGVRQRLVEAVRLRLRADVPVGVYLSGGIDSSAIAGIVTDLARNESIKIGNKQAQKVTCFSIQFGEESGYDETAIANRTAEWLGVESHKLNMTEDKLADNFAEAAYHSEHHHFDLNAVSKFALSKLVKEKGIKAVLTGEGSDEHFCGYPSFATEFLREADLAMPESILAKDGNLRDQLYRVASSETDANWRCQEASTRIKVSWDVNDNNMTRSLLAWQPPHGLYKSWVHDQHKSDWDSRKTVLAAHSKQTLNSMREKWHPAHTAMHLWNKSILINVILACLGDRTEMAHSIEGRTPFLDHHLAEYVNSLPPSVKLRYTQPDKDEQDQSMALGALTEKWILREAARPFITKELYERKKVTFWAPTVWPKGGRLHTMFQKLLTREAVENLGFVDYAAVERALERGFGPDADPASFRTLCYTGGWVTLAARFGIKKAFVEE
ncbi:hypothetical protein HIM_11604 [Hirsutella minnesotensis 3608]|uniref:Glutamine amidotransferase type-2 domain-containing protein n=1 Tax=Hirsutella minnesotensis 3608 TaxID=1043627 RepID=A0A0F7ZWH9_9HYPO|nr:hypothetical protein HIM_11604 [Hirsutella minnesotensis 3608]